MATPGHGTDDNDDDVLLFLFYDVTSSLFFLKIKRKLFDPLGCAGLILSLDMPCSLPEECQRRHFYELIFNAMSPQDFGYHEPL